MKTQRPSKSKAREILHDGTANGKKLTDKQRRYMDWVASKQAGGPVVDPNGYLESNAANFQDQMIIPGGNITTEGMAFPIMANGQPLYPNTGEYQFDTPYVVEQPMGQYRNGGFFQLGGSLDEAMVQSNAYGVDPRLQQGKNYDKNAWGMYDNASYFIENGGNPLQTPNGMGQSFLSQYGQQGRQAMTGISIFNQDPANAGLSPEARLRKFYAQQQSNPELERLRLMGATTTDPYGAYKRSNNVAAQGQYAAVTASLGRGGKYRNGI